MVMLAGNQRCLIYLFLGTTFPHIHTFHNKLTHCSQGRITSVYSITIVPVDVGHTILAHCIGETGLE
jgi:hypothetical protein